MTVCRLVEQDGEMQLVVKGKLKRESKRHKWTKVFRDWVLQEGKEGEQYVLVELVRGPIRRVKQLSFDVEEVD